MISELQIASFGFLQHKLRGSPLKHLKLLGLLLMKKAEELT
jgi:hypothetical protein